MAVRKANGYGHITGFCTRPHGLVTAGKLGLAATISTQVFGISAGLSYLELEWLLMRLRIFWACLICMIHLGAQGLEFIVSCLIRKCFKTYALSKYLLFSDYVVSRTLLLQAGELMLANCILH
jgi:hypothetical protein